ncbi:MAG: glutamine amidotransferase [Myxococcota bacterium]
MSRPLIVKTGETLPEIQPVRGDFEDWIAAGMGLERSEVGVVRVHRGEALPDPALADCIVVTGSSSMVTDREDWSERTAAWLRRVVEADTPLLGICYGHQLLAHALGGQVADNPNGREVGTVEIELEEAARTDPLLSAVAPGERLHATHVQSVLRLPDGARNLARTRLDPCHAFAVGERVFGVQSHPEFDADVMRRYLTVRRQRIASEVLDVDALLAAVEETPAGPRLLRRFAALR